MDVNLTQLRAAIPVTDTPDPSRQIDVTEQLPLTTMEPIRDGVLTALLWQIPVDERLDPMCIDDATDTMAPHVVLPAADMLDPNRPAPDTEVTEPSRVSPRTETSLPTTAISAIEQHDPHFTGPAIDAASPNRTGPITDRVGMLPAQSELKTDNDVPAIADDDADMD